MEILGSIQGESVAAGERERIQRLMREFIRAIQRDIPRELREVAYKVHFWRPFSGAKIDSLIEFRAGNQDAWYARANGTDAWRAFSKALGSLKLMIIEMEFREDDKNAGQSKSSA